MGKLVPAASALLLVVAVTACGVADPSNDLTANGDLDTWVGGAPANWTPFAGGTGSVTQDVGRGGRGSSAKIVKGSGGASISRNYEARCGAVVEWSYWTKVAGAGLGQAQLTDVRTGKFLQQSMAWSHAAEYFSYERASTTSWVEKAGRFQVEECDEGVTVLNLQFWATGAGRDPATDHTWVDDVFVRSTR